MLNHEKHVCAIKPVETCSTQFAPE